MKNWRKEHRNLLIRAFIALLDRELGLQSFTAHPSFDPTSGHGVEGYVAVSHPIIGEVQLHIDYVAADSVILRIDRVDFKESSRMVAIRLERTNVPGPTEQYPDCMEKFEPPDMMAVHFNKVYGHHYSCSLDNEAYTENLDETFLQLLEELVTATTISDGSPVLRWSNKKFDEDAFYEPPCMACGSEGCGGGCCV